MPSFRKQQNHKAYKETRKHDSFKGTQATGPEKVKTWDLLDEDFKTIILNMLKELRQIINKELKLIRKIINEQDENINKEVGIIKKNQTNTLELKSTITELKNSLEGFS